MKVIFLDIDGVCNTFQKRIDPTISHQHWTPEILKAHGVELGVRPELMNQVNEILTEVEAFVVITSSWRLSEWEKVKGLIEDYLLPGDVIGKTPYLPELTRGDEILAWLKDNLDVTHYVVLDDSAEENFPGVLDNFVRIDHHVGISDDDVAKAVKILSE